MLEFKMSFHLVEIPSIIPNISNFRGALEFRLLTHLVGLHGIIPSPSNTLF
jgi:hypothetical protein